MKISQKWMGKYELLKKYKEEHGNIDVPRNYEINGVKLGNWLALQRYIYKESKLMSERIQLLEELGINWAPHDKTWNNYYNLLKEYKEEHGNIDVPKNYEIDGMKLGGWVATQRRTYNGTEKYAITENRIQLLEELGINWSLTRNWDENYNLLKEYKNEHGNIDVPQSYEVNGIKLGNWLITQRQAYKGQVDFKITQDQIKLLEELGMNWHPRDKKWNHCYELLKEYKEEHGNIDVPTYYQIDQVNLGAWLHHQRQAYKGKKPYVITQDQIRLLNGLGIDWNIKDTKFLQKTIDDQTKEKYQQILLERINHIMDDLVNEGSNEIDSTNQKEIEKVMIKRIWK